jgi:hypothetical protein
VGSGDEPMIDFPSSPSVGQIFTAAGASWRWDGAKWVAYGGGSSGDVGRNLLHNSMFAVQQRGQGTWTANGYTVDRWLASFSSGSISFLVQSVAEAARVQIGDEAARWQMSCTFTGGAAAGDYCQFVQPIEDVQRLAGKTVTVSFYAVGSAALKLGVNLFQFFGTGGSPSASLQGTGQSVTLTTGFARYSLTFAVPSIAGKTLGTNNNSHTQLDIWFSSGSTYTVPSGSVGVQSGTITLWGIQLEIGSVATPLEKLDPQQDLAKCQRFYCTGTIYAGGYAPAGAQPRGSASLPITMRTAPSLAISGGSNYNISGFGLSVVNSQQIAGYGSATAADNWSMNTNFTASADL